jgi:hypothetical protein
MSETQTIPAGTTVRVYWNLHKKCYSVQTYVDGWKVTLHASHVQLEDVTFAVSSAGRERVRREKAKNVHAYMVGKWAPDQMGYGAPITYNPYKNNTFVCDGEPVHEAEFVYGYTSYKHPRVTAILWN